MRNAHEAAKVFKNKTSNRVGLCLYEVQEAYSSGHKFYDAKAQWYGSQRRHPGDRTPPYGAPVVFRGGSHWHIAIYVGNGKVRSTDAGGAGRMATVSIGWFKTYWGYTYEGWIGDIAGRKIDFTNHIDIYYAKLKPGVDNSDSVRFLRRTLIRRGFLDVKPPLSANHPGNKYTPAVERAVKRWQKKKGHAQTGVFTRAQAKEYFAVNKRVVLHFPA